MSTRSLTSAKLVINLSATVKNTFDDGNSATSSVSASVSNNLSTGVSGDEADRGWQWKNQTLTAASTQVIDLYDYAGIDIGGGAGNDQVGCTMTPVHEIVAIMIKNENALTSTGILEIEPDSTNGWTSIGTHTAANGGGLRGKGILLKFQPHTSGFSVVDASNHRIKLTANGANCEYSIWVLGRSDTDESSSSSSSSSSQSSSSSSSTSSQSSSSSSSSSSSFSSSSSSSTSSLSSLSSMSSSSISTSSSSVSTSSVSSSSWSSRSSSRSSISTSSSSSSTSSQSSSSFLSSQI